MLKIDVEKCKGCQLCVPACPRELLEPSQHRNKLGYYAITIRNQEDCTACALCARVCPDCVITVYRPKRGGESSD